MLLFQNMIYTPYSNASWNVLVLFITIWEFSKEYKRYSNEMQDIDVVIHDKRDLPYFKYDSE